MSQRPKAAAKAAAKGEPGVKPELAPRDESAMEAAPAAGDEPFEPAEPPAEPIADAEPAQEVESIATSESVVEPESVVEVAVELAADHTPEAIVTDPEQSPVPVTPIEETATAEVATFTTAVAEVAGQAAAIKPTQPTLTPTLTQGMKSMMKSTEDLVAFSQANFEAFVKSGQIWSAGVQELTKQIATSAKASFDESISTFKAISTAKSVKEAMDLQSSFAKAALEKAMAESNKLTDASIKLTEQALAPITARVTTAVETFKTA